MKKYLGLIVAGILLASATYVGAVKVVTISSAKITKVEISVQWSRDLSEIDAIVVNGDSILLDDGLNRAGTHRYSSEYNELPASVKTSVANVIRHLGREMSVSSIGEDVEPIVPVTIQ